MYYLAVYQRLTVCVREALRWAGAAKPSNWKRLRCGKLHEIAARSTVPSARCAHALLGVFHFLERLLLCSVSIKIIKAELNDLRRK